MGVMDKLTPDAFAEKFVLAETPLESTTGRLPVTIWIPIEYKARYDLLQAKSKQKFGKFLREVFKKTIDSVIVEKKAG